MDGNGGVVGVKNTGRSGRWGTRDVFSDQNDIRPEVIIGVQDTGSRSADGATLKQIVYNGSGIVEATLATAHFDAHPLFQFPDWVDVSGNMFCEVPVAYWWRGNLPDVGDGTTPRWTMLLSSHRETVNIGGTQCVLAANPGAFKHSGAWMDRFYCGKYRGYNAGSSKVGSKAGQAHLASVTFDNFRTYCANNGTGYHMESLFEWHEILARMVIEMGTFQLFPEAIRETPASCKWRGIEDMAYHGGTVYAEWMDGVRTDASGNYEAWEEADGSYATTGASCPTDSGSDATYFNQGLVSETGLEFLFVGATLGAAATSFIPDYSGRQADIVSRICCAYFMSSVAHHGAFFANFHQTSSAALENIGARLAKW